MACTTTTCSEVSTAHQDSLRRLNTKGAKRGRGGSLLADLELVRDLRYKGGDLLHESVHTALTTRLQQRGDGQRGDAAVRVGDEVLQVQVAGCHGRGVLHRHLRAGASG